MLVVLQVSLVTHVNPPEIQLEDVEALRYLLSRFHCRRLKIPEHWLTRSVRVRILPKDQVAVMKFRKLRW